MAFLEIADYGSAIKTDNLNSVIENNEAFLNEAQAQAKARIKGYGAMRYDMDSEFAKTGSSRDNLLIQFMVNLSLYYVHRRINPKMIPETRKNAYNDDIAVLKDIQGGQFKADWQTNADDTGSDESGRRFGNADDGTALSW